MVRVGTDDPMIQPTSVGAPRLVRFNSFQSIGPCPCFEIVIIGGYKPFTNWDEPLSRHNFVVMLPGSLGKIRRNDYGNPYQLVNQWVKGK